MKIKTSELIGNALDWAVLQLDAENPSCGFYSTDWADGGPIVEREGISLERITEALWESRITGTWMEDGPTPLIAAMRCYVGSKLGNEVEVPEDVQ